MVRIPALSRRSDPAEPVEAGQPPSTAATTTTTTEADRAAADREHARRSAEHASAQRSAAERAADRAETQQLDTARRDTAGRDTVRRGDTAETPTVGRDRGPATGTAVVDPATRPTPGPRPEPPTREETGPRPTPPPAPAGPRPRASLLATASLIVGLAAAAFVLSGALAPYGIALGVIALALGLGGISATARRHVAGRTEALIGIVLALGTMIVGSLAMTGALTWLTTETDTVNQLREWLDSQFVDRI
ncbi:thrombospondin [Solwaraspora sp. WMMD406]|uniref:thrombospondin n=1 Tax=Solwaraspora sp. WMMD406 TaxID=3016095 RepID=UPI0024176479|nr:thrombospondin [Solwaraspora sp. WMMD406]MDG4767571.1 thrombospondin [Solwaraspora sp. WMMD406]